MHLDVVEADVVVDLEAVEAGAPVVVEAALPLRHDQVAVPVPVERFQVLAVPVPVPALLEAFQVLAVLAPEPALAVQGQVELAEPDLEVVWEASAVLEEVAPELAPVVLAASAVLVVPVVLVASAVLVVPVVLAA